MTDERIALLKSDADYKDFTDDEIELFLAKADRKGLDPLTGQIYATKRRQRLIDGQYVDKIAVQTTADGLRVIAERTGKYEGQTETLWCGSDAKWVSVWLLSDPPKAARVGVYRAGFREPLYAVARWDTYAQRKRDGSLASAWAKMPDLMLAKCAKSLALREAFPNELGGIYSSEEMDQADNPVRIVGIELDDLSARANEQARERGHEDADAEKRAVEQAAEEFFATHQEYLDNLPIEASKYLDEANGPVAKKVVADRYQGLLETWIHHHGTEINDKLRVRYAEKTYDKVWRRMFKLAQLCDFRLKPVFAEAIKQDPLAEMLEREFGAPDPMDEMGELPY